MRKLSIAGSLLSAAFAFSSCTNPPKVDAIVENVSIINIETGEYLQDHILIIDDGVIIGAKPSDEKGNYEAISYIDGKNGFLMPALSDVHVHLQGAEELKTFIRYGVTTVFNMSGRALHLQLRESTASGAIIGPKIFTTGPTLDGEEVTNPLFTSVTVNSAPDIIEWIDAQGYDAIKVYQQIETERPAAVISAASARGMITTGHVSRSIGISGALEAGLKYVAHGEELAFPYFDEGSAAYDKSGLGDLAATLHHEGVTVTPMINYLENIAPQAVDLASYLASEPMQLVPAPMKQSWGERQGYYSGRNNPEQFAAQTRELVGFVSALTNALNSAGVPLVLGTDAGFGGAIPGYSAHQELQSLVRAGLTPIEALRTATLNVSSYLKDVGVKDWKQGRIKEGYAADFIILGSDPLDNISNTLDIQGVYTGGRWYNANDLANIETELKQNQIEQTPRVKEIETLIANGNVTDLRKLVAEFVADGGGTALIAPDNCIFLGYQYYYGGKRALAGEIYESCALMSPEHAPLQIHIARSKEAAGNVKDALAAYRKALSLNPWYGNPEAAIEQLQSSE